MPEREARHSGFVGNGANGKSGRGAESACGTDWTGTSIYIPKIESLEKTVRDELIKEEFDGSNYKELALKYGLTETWIRNIVLDKAKEIKARPIDGQMNLTDFLE